MQAGSFFSSLLLYLLLMMVADAEAQQREAATALLPQSAATAAYHLSTQSWQDDLKRIRQQRSTVRRDPVAEHQDHMAQFEEVYRELGRQRRLAQNDRRQSQSRPFARQRVAAQRRRRHRQRPGRRASPSTPQNRNQQASGVPRLPLTSLLGREADGGTGSRHAPGTPLRDQQAAIVAQVQRKRQEAGPARRVGAGPRDEQTVQGHRVSGGGQQQFWTPGHQSEDAHGRTAGSGVRLNSERQTFDAADVVRAIDFDNAHR